MPIAAPGRRPLICALLIFAVALFVYRPAFHFQFIDYDDPEYVTKNFHIQHGINTQSLHWAFTSFEVENWHPLTWLSHMADFYFFGPNPEGHHIVNVLLHGLNAVLLFWLLWRATGSVFPSALVGLLFAVHPLNIQSVAWVAERKNLLSTFFGLLTFAAYGWYARKNAAAGYVLALVLFVCSLMSKPYLATLPFALLLLDLWPLRRWNPAWLMEGAEQPESATPMARLLTEKAPFFLLSIAGCVVALVAQSRGGAVRTIHSVTLGARFSNCAAAYAVYLRQVFWPAKLAVFYPFARFNPLRVVCVVIVLLGISWLAWRFGRKRYFLVGWLWFLGTLVPVIGLVQIGDQSHADRYMYIPIIGVLVAVVWGVAEAVGFHPMRRRCALAAGIVVAGLLAWQTRLELAYWHDTVSLFSRAIQVTDPSFELQDMLGVALLNLGEIDDAVPHFNQALAVNSGDSVAYYNLGRVLESRGQVVAAMHDFETAITFARGDEDAVVSAGAHNNLGVLYLQMGKLDAADQHLNQAIALNPKEYKSYAALGLMYYREHRLAEAIANSQKSIDITPSAFAYFNLGAALQDSHEPIKALAAFQSALNIAPDFQEAKQKIAAIRGRNAAERATPQPDPVR